MSNRLNTVLNILIALLLIAVLMLQINARNVQANISKATPQNNPSEITVVGEATATAPPDVAHVEVGVQTTSDTLASALSDSNTKMSQVIDAIQGQGVSPQDIQTSTYMVSPQYNNTDGQGSTIVGYQVTNTVQVTIHDLNKVGGILDQATQAGANQITGLTFGLAEPSQLQADALGRAVSDAHSRAQALAQASGMQVGSVLTMTENTGSAPVPYTAPSLESANVPVPVQPGNVTLTVQVQVTYVLQ